MKVANYTDNDGSQLYGYGRWQTVGIMKGSNYRIWKVANNTDNEGCLLYG